MENLAELKYNVVQADNNVNVTTPFDEFWVARPVLGEDYGNFGLDIAEKFAGLDGLRVYGDLSVIEEDKDALTPGEFELVSNLGLIASGQKVTAKYQSMPLRRVFGRMIDRVNSVSEIIDGIEIEPAEIITHRFSSFMTPGYLIGSRIIPTMAVSVAIEQEELLEASSIYEKELIRGIGVIPFALLNIGASRETLVRVRDHINDQKLPVVSLGAAGYRVIKR